MSVFEYENIQQDFVEKRLPDSFKKMVLAEKKAELYVYAIMSSCMENFSDVEMELESDNPISKFLVSWSDDSNNFFGTNAVSVGYRDGKVVLGCRFDTAKLRDDFEVLSSDLFGTINMELFNPDNITPTLVDKEKEILSTGIQKVKRVGEVKSADK